MSKKIYGLYNDDEILTQGAKDLVGKGLKIKDVYSPFPIHGIEEVIGMSWTRLAIAGFMYGLTGLILAITGLSYFMIVDWPMNIGGKPSFSFLANMPSFVPIMFEFTVLCTAHGMGITYLLRNGTVPGATAKNPHPRTTDDHFAIEVDPAENTKFNEDEIKSMINTTKVVEVFEK